MEETKAKRIIVIGIGGAGNRIISRMVEQQIRGVEFVGIDTDLETLQNSKASKLLQIGQSFMKGYGTNADPDKGKRAAEENQDEISAALNGAEMIMIICGMGGGTGSGAACTVAKLAKKMGIFTAAIVTSPYYFERNHCILNAINYMTFLKNIVDSITVVDNDKALEGEGYTWNTSIWDRTKAVDEILVQMVRCIVDMLDEDAIMNLNLMDVKQAMQGGGSTYIGIGYNSEGKISKSVTSAVRSSWQRVQPDGAKQMLIYISGTMTLEDYTSTANFVRMYAEKNAEICIGGYQGKEGFTVMVIASGLADPVEVFLRGRTWNNRQCRFCREELRSLANSKVLSEEDVNQALFGIDKEKIQDKDMKEDMSDMDEFDLSWLEL